MFSGGYCLVLACLLLPVLADMEEGQCNAVESGKDCSDSGGSALLRTALVLGASGETGSQLLRLLVEDPAFGRIVSVGRRKVELPTGPAWSRVEQKEVDFERLEDHISAFPKVDSAFICLGTTKGKAGAEGFVKVDHDYVLASSSLLLKAGVPDLHLLTSQGSNPDSFFLYPSTKGRVEEAVRSLGFPHLSIYRPGLLLCPRGERRLLEAALQSVARLTDPYSWWSVPTTSLARAMLLTSKDLHKPPGHQVLEHGAIVRLAAEGS